MMRVADYCLGYIVPSQDTNVLFYQALSNLQEELTQQHLYGRHGPQANYNSAVIHPSMELHPIQCLQNQHPQMHHQI